MEIEVQERTQFGKSVKLLRSQGLIPAEFYGRNMANMHLTVKKEAFKKLFHEVGEHAVFNIMVGGKKQPALVSDVQRDSILGEVAHIDFYGVRMDEKIKAHVPVVLEGDAPAVKDKDAVLNQTVSELEVEALPGDLPASFSVSLAGLTELNQSMYVKDIAVPKGVKVLVDPETVVVTATKKAEEEVVVAPVADLSAVVVETEEKKTERAAAKAAEVDSTRSGQAGSP